MEGRMLKPGQEAEIEVSWEDQDRINTFSRLNTRLENLLDKVNGAKAEQEYLEDLSQELELADEDEKVMYKVADVMVSLPLEKVQELISDQQQVLKDTMDEFQTEIDGIEGEMSKLKVLLYRKFGDSINLEK